MTEYQAPLPAPVACPAGTLEFPIQQRHGVVTEEQTGDQLFYKIAPNDGRLCLQLSDLTFRVTVQGTITGGTGQFTSATGSLRTRATGRYLVFGAKAGVFGGFGQFRGRSTGTLIFPEDTQADDVEDN